MFIHPEIQNILKALETAKSGIIKSIAFLEMMGKANHSAISA